MTIENLIEQIPNILVYFVEGFIFITVFRFTSYKENKDNENSLFPLKCIVSSAVIKSAMDILLSMTKIQIKYNSVYILMLCILAAAGGFICGRIIRSVRLICFLEKLGIYRTPSTNIWDDIIAYKCETWITLRSKDKAEQYRGRLYSMEEHIREPIIVLHSYKIFRGNDIIDSAICDSDAIVLNLKDFDVIKLEYAKNTATKSE